MLNRGVTLLVFAVVACPSAVGEESGGLPLIVRSGYPRAGYFRTSEWSAANAKQGSNYQTWEKEHSVLDGIYGKVLGEEQLETEKKNVEGLTKLDYFNRYKQRFPEKLVLLHFNGNARMPVYRPGAIFPGHWLYFVPARVMSAVPAARGESTIRVSSVVPFSLAEGKYEQNGTDVCLVQTRDGTVDWSHSEQVTVTAIDEKGRAITVRRGQYGTTPLEFTAGVAWAFPHVTEGPFGSKAHKPPLLWKYNYSLDVPRDAKGRILADTLSDELAALFAPGGKLRLFDGLEFDAMQDEQRPEGLAARKQLRIDFKNDGSGDDGMREGLNRYSLGRRHFFEELRRKMGSHKIIMADLGQRGFGLLNGVESEGFPRSQWYDFVLWSERMNKLCYWNPHSASPAFSLITGKFITHDETKDLSASVPTSVVRLQIAASTLCGAAYFPFSLRNAAGNNVLISDELVMGQAGQLGWLGMPVGEAVYLSERLPDAMEGTWVKKVSSQSATVAPQGQGAVIAGKGSSDIAFTLSGVPYKNHALLVTMTVRADPRKGAPAEFARLMTVSCGQRVKTWRKQDLVFESYIGPEPFTARFYFSKNRYEIQPPSDPCKLEFAVEGSEPIHVERLEIRNAPDAAYREFEHGLVLANPSDRPFTFELASLFAGKSFVHLTATSGQDRSVNDGTPAGAAVTVPARDAVFLIRSR